MANSSPGGEEGYQGGAEAEGKGEEEQEEMTAHNPETR